MWNIKRFTAVWLGICFCMIGLKSSRAEIRQLKAGEVVQLSKPGPQFVVLSIERAAEYRIETRGESDTKCELFDASFGRIAISDHSCSKTNCRIDVRLLQGDYRLHVIKGKEPAQVSLKPYDQRGKIETLTMGEPISDQLSAGETRAFSLRVDRRRWLKLEALGVTIHHCRLFDSKGWVASTQDRTAVMATRNRRSSEQPTPQGHIQQCIFAQIFEPGDYRLEVYGDHSEASEKGNSVSQGDVVIYMGEQFIRANQWKRFNLSKYTKRTFWFEVPLAWADKSGKVRILLQTRINQEVSSWSVRLQERDWLSAFGQSHAHCYMRKGYGRQCDLVAMVDADKRYHIEVNASSAINVHTRYIGVFSPLDIPLNRRVYALDQPGGENNLEFSIERQGSYWVEAWPQTNSCVLQRLNALRQWQTVKVQSFALEQSDAKSNPPATAPSQNFVREKRWSQNISTGGMMQWLELKRAGKLQIQAEGKLDIYCGIRDLGGQILAREQNSSRDRNCLANKELKPGIYQLFVSPVSSVRQGHTQISVSLQTEALADEIPLTGGCSFPVDLQPGRYRLLSAASGQLHLGEFAVMSLPLRTGQRLRIPQLSRQLPLSTQHQIIVPVQLKGGNQWIEISGAWSCNLLQGEKKYLSGWRRGYICNIRGKIKGGIYELEIHQGMYYKNRPLLVRIGRSASFERQIYRMGRPSHAKSRAKIEQKAEVVQTGRWEASFDLARHQKHQIYWPIAEAGFYRMASRSLLHVNCRIQSARDPQLYVASQGQIGRNCHWSGYLGVGEYAVQVEAMEQSHGRVIVDLERLDMRKAQALEEGQRVYDYLPAHSGQVRQLTVATKGTYRMQVYSIDGAVNCRLEDERGWQLMSGAPCAWKGELGVGRYRLYVYAEDRAIRTRAYFNRNEQWSAFWPKHEKQYWRDIKSKPMPLALHGVSLFRYRAPQPKDELALSIPANMRIKFSFMRGLVGRLFLRDKFVHQFGGSKQKPKSDDDELVLERGEYRLDLQDARGVLNTWSRYAIGIEVLSAQPGVRLWRPIPSQIEIDVPESGHIIFETEGDRDVWCRLVTVKDAQQIATNDDAARERWDCNISQWLPQGRYRLELDGQQGNTWLDIQRPMVYTREIQAPMALTSHKIASGHIYSFGFVVEKMSAMHWAAKSTNGIVGCLLEDETRKRALNEVIGQNCDSTILLQPGRYRWHLRSMQREVSAVDIALQPIAYTELTADTQIQGGTAQYFTLSVPHNALYKLSFNLPVQAQGIQCQLALSGEALRDIACDGIMALQKGIHLLRVNMVSAKQTEALRVSLQVHAIDEGKSAAISAAQTQRITLRIQRAGMYRIDVMAEDTHPWSCLLNGSRGTLPPNAPNELRCRLYLPLAVGLHSLDLWHPHDAEAKSRELRGRVIFHHTAAMPEKSVALTTGTILEDSIKQGNAPMLYKLESSSPSYVSLTIRGDGIAMLLDSDKKVSQICKVHDGDIRTCRWLVSSHSGRSWLLLSAGDAELMYSVHLRESPVAPEAIALQPGESWDWPQSAEQGVSGRLDISLRGEGMAVVEVIGGKARCHLWSDQIALHAGCLHSLQLDKRQHLLSIDYEQAPQRILFYRPDQRVQAIWGITDSPPPPDKRTTIVPNRLQPINANTEYFQIAIAAPTLLQVRIKGHNTRCALGNDKGEILQAALNTNGCKLAYPVQSGSYWIGVHRESKAIQDARMLVSTPRVVNVTEGRHGRYLLGSGDMRWFEFTAPQNGRIGVGVVGQHDEIQCLLIDHKAKIVAQGCQNYIELPAGKYWLKVWLKADTQPTAIHVVLRGLTPPPKDPPAQYLQRMFGQQRTK